MSTDINTQNLQFSPQQSAALQSAESWYKGWQQRHTMTAQTAGAYPQVFKLFGFAGSGKTTLAAHFARQLTGSRGVLAATFTGKASLVMKRRGFNCQTIHSLIYKPMMVPVLDKEGRDTGEEELSFELNHEDSPLLTAKLLIVDEVSMVGKELGQDLLSFNKPILVLGDPGQLPPISGAGFFTSGKPDVMLTEIHRQAQDNPIIRMSMDVRSGKGIKNGSWGESKIISRIDLMNDPAQLVQADQVLCGLNKTRVARNLQMRVLRCFIPADINVSGASLPKPGEKLICLKNDRKRSLLNGGMWTLTQPAMYDGEICDMQVESLDFAGLKQRVKVPLEFFTGEEDKLLANKRRRFDEFTFGDCITVHKSQGSQWDNVLIINENYCFRENAVQWLYTGITRAAERLTLVL